MAVWHGDAGGAVLAAGGRTFDDPYTDYAKRFYPGISANERFAKNVITFLLPAHGPSVHGTTADELARRIEINLADFVLTRLKSTGQDWWRKVPLPIRQKCSARREEENDRFPVRPTST